MKISRLLLPVLLFLAGVYNAFAQQKPLVLRGATLIDVSRYGTSSHDLRNAVVIVQHGKIIAMGREGDIKIPKGAKVINVKGKYLVPGLIDCFSVIGTQGQANSHLYYGVTTIVAGPGDDRRKGYLPTADPSPHIKMLVTIPSDRLEDTLETRVQLTPADIAKVDDEIDHIDSLKKAGVATILLQHLFPEQLLTKMTARCNAYGINTIGEIQYAPYASGIKAGVNSFVHTSRYILGAMPDSLFDRLINHPFDTTINVAFRDFFYGTSLNTDPSFSRFAQALAASQTALMPTLSMLYTSLPNHQNIWNQPGAYLTNPKDVFLPMDTATGKSTSWISTKSALRQVEIEKAFIKAGVHYITGSGADAFGSLPGISEHIEIAMLHQCGLSNRQALAAATNNPSVVNHWTHIGLIAPGRDADILVLAANPLTDLENLKKINMLLLGGKMIDREALLKK